MTKGESVECGALTPKFSFQVTYTKIYLKDFFQTIFVYFPLSGNEVPNTF